MKHYHYIFAGAGLASLMTVYKMTVSGHFTDKQILLIDADSKKNNDRTWCFWADNSSIFDSIIYKSWNTAVFTDAEMRIDLDFGTMRYNMIRGIDFYTFVFDELKKHPNIEFVTEKVSGFKDDGNRATVQTNTEIYTCAHLFNSIYNRELPASQNKYPVLQQHFIGWHVRTEHSVFDENKPVFMDFSIPQKGNTQFMYVLPFAKNEALVEYTLFSKELLPEAEYENAIHKYLEQRKSGNYEIFNKERGSIPMTCYPFWENNSKNVTHIGSAGGWTKASTGYTFRNADKLSDALVKQINAGKSYVQLRKKDKFWYYDLLLLDILSRNNEKGHKIFSAIFSDGKARDTFKFLDEETSLSEDLKVIMKCPKSLFINAALRRLLHLQPKK
ncbi:MAG: lycopene cyclase family protein [Flavobacterium sp.]